MRRPRSSPHTMIEGVPELAALGEENRRTYSHGSISFHIPIYAICQLHLSFLGTEIADLVP